MGTPPGPIYREILRAVLDAKLNGRVKTRAEELEFARKRLREELPDSEPIAAKMPKN
jgi:tRNA nucleotidyltransferase (CCA-adding enzyme)